MPITKKKDDVAKVVMVVQRIRLVEVVTHVRISLVVVRDKS